jgi:hypothetical protein
MNTGNLTTRGGTSLFFRTPILEKQRTILWISGAKARFVQKFEGKRCRCRTGPLVHLYTENDDKKEQILALPAGM